MELEVHGIFLDICKAIDKVWHDGLIFKLHQNGIFSEMVNILEDFLSDRKKRVVLNGQCSSWVDIWAGVPQRSILWPFFNTPEIRNDYILSTKRFDFPLTNFWFVLEQLCIENMSLEFYI